MADSINMGGKRWQGWIEADWPAPPGVRAGVTTRLGGVSTAPFDSLNLGDHVGDDGAAVAANRALLEQRLGLPGAPCWLRQVHGTAVVELPAATAAPEADGAFTRQSGVVCAVLTADCLPLLLCDREGRRVAALHAGWRGLAAGVVEQTLDRLGTPAAEVMAWLGPAIGPDAFEVGEEVRRAFLDADGGASGAFRPSPSGRWLADLCELARRRLKRRGVEAIYGGHWCTFGERERFFSYRRDGTTGRMASLIWIEPQGTTRRAR